MNMVDSWARHREDGRVYKKMCRMLKGAELSLNELGRHFQLVLITTKRTDGLLCEFVKNNYKDPNKVRQLSCRFADIWLCWFNRSPLS